MLFPPEIVATISFRKKVRYQASAGITNGAISAQDLARLYGFGVTTTSLASMLDAIHLVKVQIWSPAIIGAITALEFKQETTTFIGSPSKTISDICVSTAVPARVKAKPPPNSLSGFWIDGGATSTSSVINLTIAENSVVDFTFDFRFIDNGSDPGPIFTVSGAVVGVIYLRNLCSGDLVPVSFPGTS